MHVVMLELQLQHFPCDAKDFRFIYEVPGIKALHGYSLSYEIPKIGENWSRIARPSTITKRRPKR